MFKSTAAFLSVETHSRTLACQPSYWSHKCFEAKCQKLFWRFRTCLEGIVGIVIARSQNTETFHLGTGFCVKPASQVALPRKMKPLNLQSLFPFTCQFFIDTHYIRNISGVSTVSSWVMQSQAANLHTTCNYKKFPPLTWAEYYAIWFQRVSFQM
jgi:hypothetical protein